MSVGVRSTVSLTTASVCWPGGQSSHVQSSVRGVMRGANGVRERVESSAAHFEPL